MSVSLPAWSISGSLLDRSNSRGRLELFRPAPLVLMARCNGHFTEDLADEWVRVLDPILATTRGITMFNEWREMTGYDSASRQKLTKLASGRKGVFTSVYFVTNSRIVTMGVNVASVPMAMIGVTFATCASDEDFFEKLERVRPR